MKRFSCLLAIGLSVLTASASAVSAQQTSGPASKPAPTPTLDAEALKIPHSVPSTSENTLKVDKNKKALPPPSIPNKVDLGKYDLEFKAGQTSDVNPRTGLDSGEKSNLSNTSVGRQPGSALPDYFGLKLSTPTE